MECWVKALMISIPSFRYSSTIIPSLHIFITPFLLLFVHLCPGSYVGENFKQD